MVIAALLGILFALDLVMRLPAGGITPTMNTLVDVVFIICGLILGYLSWSTWRMVA
ncbi:MAG: hypothetical protein ACUVUC_07545 [Thermoguttaceae bacterium]